MIGFLQCMLISSCGGNFTNTIKAIPLEKPLQRVAKESNVIDSSGKSLNVEDPMEPKDKNDNSITSVDKDKQVSSNKSHSIAVSILHQDISTMKGSIDKDYEKEYAFSLHDLPGDQKSKQFYLDSIETLFRECSKAGGLYISRYIRALMLKPGARRPVAGACLVFYNDFCSQKYVCVCVCVHSRGHK